jgi:hypothetical protein
MAVVAVPGLTPSESARSPVCATGTAVVRRYTALSASRSDFDSTSSPFSMGVNLGFAPSRVQRGAGPEGYTSRYRLAATPEQSTATATPASTRMKLSGPRWLVGTTKSESRPTPSSLSWSVSKELKM